jgi:hypothetical protein
MNVSETIGWGDEEIGCGKGLERSMLEKEVSVI